jgi:hypothetical protein
MKFTSFTASYNFEVDNSDKDVQIKVIDLLSDSVLKEKLSDVRERQCYVYLPAHHFVQATELLAKYVL